MMQNKQQPKHGNSPLCKQENEDKDTVSCVNGDFLDAWGSCFGQKEPADLASSVSAFLVAAS